MTDITKNTDSPIAAIGELGDLIPSEQETKQVKMTEDLPFLPSIKLIQGVSSEVERDDISQGDFFIGSKDLNVGPRVEIVVFDRRAHALLLDGNKKIKETYRSDSPLFKDIALTPDDRANNIVSFSGLGDWLFWLPEQSIFVTYFCGKRSTRPLTDSILDYLTPITQRTTVLAKEKPFTNSFELYSHFETRLWGPRYKCYIPKVTPLDLFSEDMDKDLLLRATAIFRAPAAKESTMEEAHPDVIDR
jgi:hypothetical protein